MKAAVISECKKSIVRVGVCLSIVFMLLVGSSCGLETQETVPTIDSIPARPQIGVSVLDGKNPYYQQLVEGIRTEAEVVGADIHFEDPESDPARQAKSIRGFIDAGMQAIIIAALDPQTIEPLLKEAMEKGIRVVAQSTKVENCDIYVSFDEWEIGHVLGQAAGSWIQQKLNGEASILLLNYPQIPQINNREKGIRDGIEEFAPNAVIVASASASIPEDGYLQVRDLLKIHQDAMVVVAINDGGAMGALEAFNEAGLDLETAFVGGIDATPDALKSMQSGSLLRCSVDIAPKYNGQMDLRFAMSLLNGRIVPSRFTYAPTLISQEGFPSP